MTHTVFIAIHALAGLVAFVSGCLAVPRPSLFGVHLWSLVTMVAFLAAAVVASWTGLDGASRVVFAAFLALAGLMIWHAVRARALLAGPERHPSPRYLDHLGFTLVALLDGFTVVAVLDVGAPAWSAAVVGVAVAVAGHVAIGRTKNAFARPIEHDEPAVLSDP